MFSPWIAGLRSVALNLPDLAQAEAFYTEVWQLQVAARTPGTPGAPSVLWLRGSGADHHLLALHQDTGRPAIRKISLRAREAAHLHAIAAATLAAGGQVLQAPAPAGDPAGGIALLLRCPHGRVFEIVHGDALHASTTPHPDRPTRLAHAVLNSHDTPATQAFLERALGFVLADRTRIMAFMNCNSDHHSLAVADANNDALNHIAFLLPSLDAVMRGGGRMRDAGHAIEWGPGRHGPGDNAFNYFIDPFGVVIEYTAEVEQVDERYRVRMPADWAWPPGRVDQWGISAPPSPRLRQAQRDVFFTTAQPDPTESA